MFNPNRCMEMDGNMPGANTAMPNVEMGGGMSLPGVECAPIYECPQERVCHREICHHVQHIQPVNTRIINHHVYRHTCTPCYTMCEENVCSDVFDPCGRF